MAYYYEITELSINISNAIDFSIYDGTHYYDLTANFEGDSNNSLCTNLNPTDLSYNWDIWGQLILEADTYTSRVFEIDSGVPTLISNDPATNLSLYLIKVANSSSVTYEWLTTEFQYIDGIMRIYKCTNNTRVIVESTPVVSGLANANIELITQAYSYDIIIDGVLFQDFDSFSKCHVESSTLIRLFVDVAVLDVNTVIGLNSVDCTLERINNESARINWSINSNNASYVTGCILTYLQNSSGSFYIGKNCSTSGYSYSVDLDLDSNNEYVILGKLEQGENYRYCGGQLAYGDFDTDGGEFGATGLLGAIFIILALMLMFAGDGLSILIGGAVGIIGAFLLGILNLPWIVIASLLLFIILMGAIARVGKK